MANTIRIAYVDGRRDEVRLTPRTLIAAERHLGKDWADHPMEATFYGAWVALNPGIEFDDWLDTIDPTVSEEVDASSPLEAGSSTE